jgi:hypothetical protein
LQSAALAAAPDALVVACFGTDPDADLTRASTEIGGRSIPREDIREVLVVD